jgi:hypothetical protein
MQTDAGPTANADDDDDADADDACGDGVAMVVLTAQTLNITTACSAKIFIRERVCLFMFKLLEF